MKIFISDLLSIVLNELWLLQNRQVSDSLMRFNQYTK